MSGYRAKIYENGKIIARVRNTMNLSYWDGKRWTIDNCGIYKGITRLRNGKFVLIESDWRSQKDKAYIISEEEALQEIIKSGNIELLDLKRFKPIRELYEKRGLCITKKHRKRNYKRLPKDFFEKVE